MIAQLTGHVVLQRPPLLVFEVNGVGYEVQAPMTTFYRLPKPREQALDEPSITLYTHLHIREDAHVLFGFIQEGDRQLFRDIIKVNGVGPKLALAILSGMDVETFAAAIHHQDVQSLVSLPGLGKKTAERLIIDMQDRIKDLSAYAVLESQQAARVVALNTGLKSEQVHSESMQEAQQALESLGYKAQQASKVLAQFEACDWDSQTLIKSALKALVR